MIECQTTGYRFAIRFSPAHHINSYRLYVKLGFAWLGASAISKQYSIKSVMEAKAYLSHPLLGPRLTECVEAALGVEGRSAHEIFGSPDDIKLRSCATLFDSVSPTGSVFDLLLEKFFQGERDRKTLCLLEAVSEREECFRVMPTAISDKFNGT